MRRAVAADGFVFVRGATLRELLGAINPLSDVDAFAASWNDLSLDTYMADGGRYRRRRAGFMACSRTRCSWRLSA